MGNILLKKGSLAGGFSNEYGALWIDNADGLLKLGYSDGSITSPFPISLTAGQIASPSAGVLADVNATYQLNVAPYTRYRSNGTALVSYVLPTQTFFQSFYVPSVTDGTVAIIPMDVSGTITKVITQSTSGTCTITTSIEGASLGGGISSVSSTKSTVTHNSINTFSAGSDIMIVASANSSCVGLRITIAFTRQLT